jgi:hypothetical protein
MLTESPQSSELFPKDSGPALSALTIHLLKGPLYANEKPKLWSSLLESQQHVRSYLSVINLALFLDEAEGYAFLRQIEAESSDDPLPRLIQRRPLGFALSVLCILLRQWLSEHDVKGGDLRTIINRDQIHSELGLYLPALRNESKFSDRIDRYITQAIELGLIRELKGDKDKIEILRITKALINAEWLGDLQDRLAQYRSQSGQELGDDNHVS